MIYSRAFPVSQLSCFLLVAIFGIAGLQSCGGSTPPGAGHTISSIQGQVIDQRGRPVSQCPVKIDRTDGDAGATVAFTDFSGTFQFVNLQPGSYRLYPLAEGTDQARTVEVGPGEEKAVGTLTLHRQVKVELNKEAAQTINPDAAKTINADAAQTVNAEAAKTLNVEAAKTINAEAARTLNKEAAATINPAAAKTINAEAANTINPAAAKVLDPQRAMILTKDEAKTITPDEARKPLVIQKIVKN